MSIDEQVKAIRKAATEIQRAKFGYESLIKAEASDNEDMKALALEMLAELPKSADDLLAAINGEDDEVDQ